MRHQLPARGSYAIVLMACWVAGLLVGWSSFGVQLDNDAYDFMMRVLPARGQPQASVILAVDEETLQSMGGLRKLREIVARGVATALRGEPAVVVVDLILADPGDPTQDAVLEEALKKVPRLVLPAELTGGGWEDPLPRFARWATAIGHVHAAPDPLDNVTRQIPLEKATPSQRRWALALEAYRVWRSIGQVIETPHQLELGRLVVPAPQDQARPLFVRYFRRVPGQASSIPTISVAELIRRPERAESFRGKVVFVGVTAQSAADDRHMTPYSAGLPMPGVEIHAAAFETLVRGEFLRPLSDWVEFSITLLVAVAAGVAFWRWAGWWAYGIALGLMIAAHLLPLVLFRQGWLLAFAPVSASTWFCLAGAASYQYFVTRRRWQEAERGKQRYQQAIQFVTHEMRSPLTTIQGSSELIGKYELDQARRRQLAEMIHSESRRLARLVETFLNVERLSAGQMELNRAPVDVQGLVERCVARARPLAERKTIAIDVRVPEGLALAGDEELLEFAVYNLLNNAIKYSPAGKRVEVCCRPDGDTIRLWVQDQGMGIEPDELPHIFKKFYRTRRAEASGEKGTGIGLAIVQQIVEAHGGRIEVTSRPGEGSCFTLVLPASNVGRVVRRVEGKP